MLRLRTFTGPTPQVVIAQRFTETPRPLGAMRERLLVGLEQVVARAVARAPADRIQTAAEFARESARTSAAPASDPDADQGPSEVMPPDLTGGLLRGAGPGS